MAGRNIGIAIERLDGCDVVDVLLRTFLAESRVPSIPIPIPIPIPISISISISIFSHLRIQLPDDLPGIFHLKQLKCGNRKLNVKRLDNENH